jgi:hypothetical protein
VGGSAPAAGIRSSRQCRSGSGCLHNSRDPASTEASPHSTFILVSLAAKITTGVAAVAIVGLAALAALAVPAFASLGQAAQDTAEGVSNIVTLESSPEPVAAEPTPAPTPRDDMQAAAWKAGCDDFVDVSVWVNGEKTPAAPRPRAVRVRERHRHLQRGRRGRRIHSRRRRHGLQHRRTVLRQLHLGLQGERRGGRHASAGPGPQHRPPPPVATRL